MRREFQRVDFINLSEDRVIKGILMNTVIKHTRTNMAAHNATYSATKHNRILNT